MPARPVVNTDEGPKPEWTTKEMDYTLMTYTLKEASMVAERYGIKIGLEPHQQYSKSLKGLDSIYNLVKSPAIGINYDTGNSYLAGTDDTYEWLDHVDDRLVHLHAKDISFSAERRGARQGHRHPRRLRLRRWRGGLEAGDRDRQEMPERHRLQRRVRHRPRCHPQF